MKGIDMYGHCEHCPTNCTQQHTEPLYFECTECSGSYEQYLDRVYESHRVSIMS